MHAFNLTRLNFHSPYKVWTDNGSYKFLTDYGVQYRIEFVENNNIWENEKAYEFGILNENKKNSTCWHSIHLDHSRIDRTEKR